MRMMLTIPRAGVTSSLGVDVGPKRISHSRMSATRMYRVVGSANVEYP